MSNTEKNLKYNTYSIGWMFKLLLVSVYCYCSFVLKIKILKKILEENLTCERLVKIQSPFN